MYPRGQIVKIHILFNTVAQPSLYDGMHTGSLSAKFSRASYDNTFCSELWSNHWSTPQSATLICRDLQLKPFLNYLSIPPNSWQYYKNSFSLYPDLLRTFFPHELIDNNTTFAARWYIHANMNYISEWLRHASVNYIAILFICIFKNSSFKRHETLFGYTISG